MLIEEPTPEMIAEWKKIFAANHFTMKPNRKTGNEVNQYFRKKYSYEPFDDIKFQKTVALNIIENKFSHNKFLPEIQSYRMGDILIGIDLISGEFYIECENIYKCIPVYDDLFVYRGLDEEDLKNYFLVAEYVRLTQK